MTQLFRGFPGSEIRGFGAPVPPTPASGKALGLPLGGQGQPGRAMARGPALRVHRFRGRSCHTRGHPGPSGDFRVATMVAVNEQFQWPFSHDRRKPRPRLGALPCAPVANALSPTFLPSFYKRKVCGIHGADPGVRAAGSKHFHAAHWGVPCFPPFMRLGLVRDDPEKAAIERHLCHCCCS